MHPFELNPTFSFTLLGTFFIYLWTRPSWRAVAAIFILAAVLRAICQSFMGGFGAYYGVSWISWGAFLGIGTLIVLAVQIVGAGAPGKAARLRTFYAGAVFPVLGLLDGYSVPINIWLRPKTYDAFLLAFDGSLGFQPSFVLGHILLQNHTAWGLTTVIYYALPFAVSLVYASDRGRSQAPVAVLALFLATTIVGFAQYSLYPAVGPRYAFAAAYPQAPPALLQVALQPMTVPDSPRNCMPSLHLAGALLVWWNSRHWPRWGKVLVALFVLATVFATLALGEHYLADLVVAVPFALIFQSACTRAVSWSKWIRKISFFSGIVVTVIWLCWLRFGVPWFAPLRVVSWGLILATLVWSLVLERHLHKAASAPEIRPAHSL